MTTEQRNAIRMKLTVTQIVNCDRVKGKPYDRMDFIADTDRTDKPIPFVVFKPEIIDAVYVGNSFPADIEIQHKDDKTESVVVKAYLPDKTEIYRNGRETISSVSLMLSDKVEIPQDIVNSHWDLVRKYQKEALR